MDASFVFSISIMPTGIFVTSCYWDICVIAEMENNDNFNIMANLGIIT